MTIDSTLTPPSDIYPDEHEEKLALYVEEDLPRRAKYHVNGRRSPRWTSHLYVILLSLLVVLLTITLIIVLTRSSSVHRTEEEQYKPSLKEQKIGSVSCTAYGHSCVCPASFIHSPLNPTDCIPSGSRCLHSCQENEHCHCYQLKDVVRCQQATRRWIESELHVGSVQPLPSMLTKQSSSIDTLERFLAHYETLKKHVFFTKDHRTAITLDGKQENYLLNELWTKLDVNTTEQHLVYSQVEAPTHSCLLSSVWNDGSIVHGRLHTCPGTHGTTPYFFASACDNVLILWHGEHQLNHLDQEDWVFVRHNFETMPPNLPVVLDPFHRYYSLYDDSMLEIKDLNGNTLAQLFVDIQRPTKFQFTDFRGTFLVANQTHMQLFTTLNQFNWLDV